MKIINGDIQKCPKIHFFKDENYFLLICNVWSTTTKRAQMINHSDEDPLSSTVPLKASHEKKCYHWAQSGARQTNSEHSRLHKPTIPRRFSLSFCSHDSSRTRAQPAVSLSKLCHAAHLTSDIVVNFLKEVARHSFTSLLWLHSGKQKKSERQKKCGRGKLETSILGVWLLDKLVLKFRSHKWFVTRLHTREGRGGQKDSETVVNVTQNATPELHWIITFIPAF